MRLPVNPCVQFSYNNRGFFQETSSEEESSEEEDDEEEETPKKAVVVQRSVTKETDASGKTITHTKTTVVSGNVTHAPATAAEEDLDDDDDESSEEETGSYYVVIWCISNASPRHTAIHFV